MPVSIVGARRRVIIMMMVWLVLVGAVARARGVGAASTAIVFGGRPSPWHSTLKRKKKRDEEKKEILIISYILCVCMYIYKGFQICTSKKKEKDREKSGM